MKKSITKVEQEQEEKKLSIKLPLSLHTKIKLLATTQNETMEKVVCRALRKELERKKRV